MSNVSVSRLIKIITTTTTGSLGNGKNWSGLIDVFTLPGIRHGMRLYISYVFLIVYTLNRSTLLAERNIGVFIETTELQI